MRISNSISIIDSISEVLSTVKHYCDNHRVPYYNFEIRTTQQDDAMMSCCSDRDAMWIDFQAKANISKEFFGAMEDLLRPIGFRKHWAKGLENTDPAYVVDKFDRIADFVELMKDFDPEGKFRNKQGEEWYHQMRQILVERGILKLDDETDEPHAIQLHG